MLLGAALVTYLQVRDGRRVEAASKDSDLLPLIAILSKAHRDVQKHWHCSYTTKMISD